MAKQLGVASAAVDVDVQGVPVGGRGRDLRKVTGRARHGTFSSCSLDGRARRRAGRRSLPPRARRRRRGLRGGAAPSAFPNVTDHPVRETCWSASAPCWATLPSPSRVNGALHRGHRRRGEWPVALTATRLPSGLYEVRVVLRTLGATRGEPYARASPSSTAASGPPPASRHRARRRARVDRAAFVLRRRGACSRGALAGRRRRQRALAVRRRLSFATWRLPVKTLPVAAP